MSRNSWPNFMQEVKNDTWLYVGLVALVIWLPLPFAANRPWHWWLMEVWSILLMIAWLLKYYFAQVTPNATLSQAKLSITALLVVCAWIAAQAFETLLWGAMSSDPHETQVQLIKTIVYVVLFVLLLLLVNSKRRLQLLIVTLVYCGTLQALYGILINSKGMFINRNHFAGYLEMTLALGIGMLIAHLNHGRPVTWRESLRRLVRTMLGPKMRVRICIVLMVIGLIISRSRMGNTAFFTSMLLSGALGLFLFRRSSRSVVILFVSMIVIDFFLMGTFFGIDKLEQRFTEARIVGDQRVVYQVLSTEMARENLLLGVGAGSFYSEFPKYRNDEVTSSIRHAHNDLIQFPAELGVLGAGLLAIVVLMALITSVKVQYLRRDPFFKAMGFSSTMGIIAIMMHSSTDFNLQVTANAGTFMVLLALPYLAMSLDRHDH